MTHHPDIVAEAVEWLRKAAEKREAGVQGDKRHHERSRAPFDMERARRNATLTGGLRLDHANAILALIEAQAAEIAGLREALVPFAENIAYVDEFLEAADDEFIDRLIFTAGQYRAAATAIASGVIDAAFCPMIAATQEGE